MGYLAAPVPVFVNGKGWRGLGFGFGGRKNVGMVPVPGMVIVKAPSAESPARVGAVGVGLELLAGLVQGRIELQHLQTVGHPERDQLQ